MSSVSSVVERFVSQALMSISFDSKVRIPDDVLVSQLDGESVLLKLKSECYFGLDEIGTRIWDLLLSSDSIQHAYETVLSEFDVDPGQALQDARSFVEELALIAFSCSRASPDAQSHRRLHALSGVGLHGRQPAGAVVGRLREVFARTGIPPTGMLQNFVPRSVLVQIRGFG